MTTRRYARLVWPRLQLIFVVFHLQVVTLPACKVTSAVTVCRRVFGPVFCDQLPIEIDADSVVGNRRRSDTFPRQQASVCRSSEPKNFQPEVPAWAAPSPIKVY